MTKLQELWNTYSSQELFGESLREEDPELFDELDAAITEADEREPLVREVIGTVREMFGAPITMDAYCERRERLVQVARKLSEWKP